MTSRLRRELATACPDRVIGPDHPAYDSLRQLFNGMHDVRPQLICLPKDGSELARVIQAARSTGLRTTLRGGGHNIAGAGTVADGLVIDMRLLNQVNVSPRDRTATVAGGATWNQMDLATSLHGLATTGGTFDTTGVGGLTLGGGIGHLMGRYGLTCDNVLSYEVVTANGEQLTVNRDTDPELDWALRGAGHNFAAVTAFRFRLHPVATVYGGYVAYPESELEAAVRLFREVMTTAPDELTCTLLLERHGPTQAAAAVMSVAYCGADEEHRVQLEKTLQSVPVADWQIQHRTYVSMQSVLGRLPFGLRHYWSARCVSELPDELVEGLVARFLASRWQEPFNNTVLIEPFHGAVRSASAEHSAVPFRSARFHVTGMAIWTPPEADAEQIAWARSVSALAEPYNHWGSGYTNYSADHHGAARVFSPEAYRRLQELKRRIDPDGFFRSHYDISR